MAQKTITEKSITSHSSLENLKKRLVCKEGDVTTTKALEDVIFIMVRVNRNKSKAQPASLLWIAASV